MLTEVLPITNQSGCWTKDRARAEQIAILCQRDDEDGRDYRVNLDHSEIGYLACVRGFERVWGRP